MSGLEPALRELETATAALAEVPIAKLRSALERRSLAVARVAELLFASEDREEILGRLLVVMEAGSRAQQRITALRRSAVAEWSQWSRIYRALGGEPESRIDYRG
jgi:hypothetical protein